jgi:hypothetical protein
MSYQKFLDNLEYLKNSIEKENTGSTIEIASKLGISRRTLFNYLDILKYQDYNIKFCRYRKTYYFDHN